MFRTTSSASKQRLLSRIRQAGRLGVCMLSLSMTTSAFVAIPKPVYATNEFHIYWGQGSYTEVTGTYNNGYITNPQGQVVHVNFSNGGRLNDDNGFQVGYYTGNPPA